MKPGFVISMYRAYRWCYLHHLNIAANNVKIGANIVVNFDVPDNCTVVRAKGKIISHDKLER